MCEQSIVALTWTIAPDLLVGYGDGYRASWDSVMGKVTGQIFEDNLKAWSGDHCIDPRLVPGVLFSSHKIADDKPPIVDVAPTILKLFGLGVPGHFDGKAWTMAGEPMPAQPPVAAVTA